MNILFLDIDGVLNSQAWFHTRHENPAYQAAKEQMRQSFRDWTEDYSLLRKIWDLDPTACQVLQTIVEETECQVVLSSVWKTNPKATVEAALSRRGFVNPLLHRTRDIAGHTKVDQYKRSDTIRGLEIEHWLLTHVDPPDWLDLRIVIIDDSSDMGRLHPWLVQTDNETGLLPQHAPLVVKALRMPLEGILANPNPLWTNEAKEDLYGPS